MNKLLVLAATVLLTALLAACAGMRTVSTEVSSFGDWPAARQPGTYAFDRLPSQQAQLADTEQLEAAARTALEKSGFKPAADGQAPDVLVQVGARTIRTDRPLWDDPLWWHGGFGYWRYAPYGGPGWALSAQFNSRPRYDREVALLLRDRASGKPLFETHASTDSGIATDPAGLVALFQAAMTDFPRLGLNPRTVVVTLTP